LGSPSWSNAHLASLGDFTADGLAARSGNADTSGYAAQNTFTAQTTQDAAPGDVTGVGRTWFAVTPQGKKAIQGKRGRFGGIADRVQRLRQWLGLWLRFELPFGLRWLILWATERHGPVPAVRVERRDCPYFISTAGTHGVTGRSHPLMCMPGGSGVALASLGCRAL
jgi:hypothetical protein